jgi:hypothetical protein
MYAFYQNKISKDLVMRYPKRIRCLKLVSKEDLCFFILMMNHLLSDTEEVAQSLNERVK